MAVNLSVKNAPDEVMRRLKERAARHHRSPQGVLLGILEDAVSTLHELTPREVLAKVQAFDLRTPDEAAEITRTARDER